MVVNYSPKTYSGLPTVAEAADTYHEVNASSSLNDIGKVFFTHEMQKKFGIALLHRHFQLPENERIVEYGGVATAWPIDSPLPLGAEIRPTNWSLQSGTAQPYEFEFVPRAESCDEEGSELDNMFLSELHSFLKEKQLLDVFGLVKLPRGEMAEQPTFEATIGRVSLTFPGDDMNKGVGAMWRFEESGGSICARVCSQCRDFDTC